MKLFGVDPLSSGRHGNRRPHYWFRRNQIGWGLEPGSREGWIATALFVVVTVGGVLRLGPFVG
ncbi:MAG: hypothetical protein WAK19_05950, partial [Candidatus Cybelea sp.]